MESWNTDVCQQFSFFFFASHQYPNVPSGPFLVCRDCKLSFQFPDGMKYGAIAKQFEFHSCGSTERHFAILKHKGKVPAMASCANCQRKFFTPSRTCECDPIGAEPYLANKFDLHRCEELKR